MKAQDLKNSILQMAMEGKLVPQDPNDEPASVLLERIREEKEQLIKEKKIKRNNKESVIFRKNNHFYEKIGKNGEEVCIDEDMPWEIPNTWEWVRFGSIVNFSMGKTPQRKNPEFWENGTVPWVSIADMKDREVIFSTKEKINENALEKSFKNILIPKDTLLMSFKLTVGRVSILGMDAVHNEAIISIKPFIDDEFALRDYLFWILPIISQYGDTKSAIKGKTLNSKSLNNLLLPIPNLNEQKRIVEKLNELNPFIEQYDGFELSLENLNNQFPKKIKDSILQEAIQGKLVPQNLNDEPASVLLERIKEEKEHLIKEKKIKRNKNESFIFKENSHFYEKIGKTGEKVCIDEEIPFDIPNSWQWYRLENITSNVHYGFTASAQENGNVRLLRITDIHENYVDWESVPCCNISNDKYNKYNLKNRDIVMARTGGTIGKSYIIENLNKNAVFASYLIRIIPLNSINERYLKLFFESPLFWSQLKDNTQGTGQPNVNARALKNLLIPLPPYNEQTLIIKEVKKIFKVLL